MAGRASARIWRGRIRLLMRESESPDAISVKLEFTTGDTGYLWPLARAFNAAFRIASEVIVAPLVASTPLAPCLKMIC